MGRTVNFSEEEYLAPGFDPNRLTKPQLRSILSSHGIADLPAVTARKEALVELFQLKIQSKASEIIKQRGRIRASDKGIAFLDEKSQPSPKRTPVGQQRQSLSPVKSHSQSSSPQKNDAKSPTKKATIKSASPERSRSVRRSREKLRSKSPLVQRGSRAKTPSPDPKVFQTPRVDSPLEILQQAMPKFASSPRASTMKLHDRLEFIASANKLSHTRLSSLKKQDKLPGKTLPFSPLRVVSKIGFLLRHIVPVLQFLLFALLSVAVGIYLRLKYFYPLSYCADGSTPSSFCPRSWQPSEILSAYSRMCVPCPIHAHCRNGVLICEEGFVSRSNWLALGSSCRPDFRKLSLIDDIVTKIRTVLAEKAGRAICDPSHNKDSFLKQEQIAEILRERFPFAEWHSEGFDSLYRLAIQDIKKNPSLLGLETSHDTT